jgi:Mg-chelatase subunit ChlD
MHAYAERQNYRAELTTRFRMLVAAFGCPGITLDIARKNILTHTNGDTIFLRADARPAEQLVEVAVQCSLLAAGSLVPAIAFSLLGQPQRAQRYLGLEVARLCAAPSLLFRHVVPPAWMHLRAMTDSPEASLAYSARTDFDPPVNTLFGVIRPMALLNQRDAQTRGTAHADDLKAPAVAAQQNRELDDEEDAQDAPQFFQRFASPLRMAFNPFAQLFNRILGARRSASEQAPGGEIPSGFIRQSQRLTAQGRRAHYTLAMQANANRTPQLVAGWRYPEWHCAIDDYRPDWVHVHETPLAWVRDMLDTQASLPSRQALLRQLKKLSFGRARTRAQREGDDFDLNALIERAVTLHVARRGREGAVDQANVYSALRRSARDIAMLIAVDVSGSSAETNATGHVVAREQAMIAAALAEASAQCGDRVAVTAFHSRTRQFVRSIHVKNFDERWSHRHTEALLRLRPSGFSRLGAVLRHSANLLERESGMPRRLLVVVSDGFAYDADYQGRHACEDVQQALRELAANRIHVLWISLGDVQQEIAASLASCGYELIAADSAFEVMPLLARALTATLTRRQPRDQAQRPVAASTIKTIA